MGITKDDLILLELRQIHAKLDLLLQNLSSSPSPSPSSASAARMIESTSDKVRQEKEAEEEEELDPTMRVISADQGYVFRDPAEVAAEAEKRFQKKDAINAKNRLLMEEHYKETLKEREEEEKAKSLR